MTLTYDLVSLPVIGQNLPRAGLVTDWEFQVPSCCLFTFEAGEFSFASLSVIKLLDGCRSLICFYGDLTVVKLVNCYR